MNKFYKANIKIVSKQNKKLLPKSKQFKYLSFLLNFREKLVLKLLILLVLITSGFFIYKGLSLINEIPVNGGSYTEGIVGKIKYLNPVLASSNNVDMDIDQLIYSGLFKFNNRTLENDIVESYTVSDDQKTYTFKIKPNVFWHDGKALTTEDILYTVNLIKNPSFRSPLYLNLKTVKIEKTNDLEFKMELEKPSSPFLSTLTFGILPKHIWEDINYIEFPLSEFNLKPIGSGPYKFKSISKSKQGVIKSYTVEKNTKYFEKEAYINEITFKFLNDEDEIVTAMQDKKIDGANYISYNNLSLLNNKSFNFYPLYLPQYEAIFINQSLNDLLKEKYIRQVLYYGINKSEIIDKVYDGNAENVESPFLKDMIGYNADFKNYEFNPQKALEILAENGWKRNPTTTLMEKDGKTIEFTITAIDNADSEELTEILKTQFYNLGISIKIDLIDEQLIKEDIIKTRNYDLLLYGEVVGADPDIYAFWHSSQIKNPGLNLSMYSNSTVDTEIEKARQTNNEDERKKSYLRISEQIKEDVPAIFLVNPAYNYVVSDKVKGVNEKNITSASNRFENIENWYIKTRKKIF